MRKDAALTTPEPLEPRWPTLVATGAMSVWIAILSLPMLSGKFVAGPYNDQYSTGYAFREWAAHQWKSLGHFPLWNPEIYGGMPHVAGMHGDLFYPTAWLRLVLPTDVAMNLGFVIHYVLAGLLTYLFLRRLRLSWTASVVGGLAYQLSGVIGSYVSPGHDGKLFVTAMLPLGFIGLTLALRDRRWVGYSLFALSVGLALLSPHPQMAQYYLFAAGIYALYLSFGEKSDVPLGTRFVPLGIALAAVAVGVGIAAIQYLPFYAYIPFSPRDQSVIHDVAWSATYAIPWYHVPELVISRFTGESFNGTYWATNGVKLHSEYLGLSVIALAVLGVLTKERRRFVSWFCAIGGLFLLVALGTSTPFFQLWWSVVPFVKSTRAPGMALFVVSFIVSVFAAFGAQRLLRGDGAKHITAWFVVGGLVAGLGLLGAFGGMAESFAQGLQASTGIPYASAAVAGQNAVRVGATINGFALIVIAGIGLGIKRQRLPVVSASLLLVAVIGTDLWWNARTFWQYSDVQSELFGEDDVKTFLANQPKPLRVWSIATQSAPRGVYPGSALMADDIAQWYGHHGNELHLFDVLNGRNGLQLSFANEGHPNLLDLFAINYIIIDAASAPDSVPGFERALSNVTSSSGIPTVLLQRSSPVPYARLVPAAVKAERGQAVATILDQRFPGRQVVLLDQGAEVEPQPVGNSLPEPLDVQVQFDHWEPGLMRMTIPGGAPANGYLVVAENYYRDWRATVDGQKVPVLAGNVTLITVPVQAGAREVELSFVSPEYQRGKAVMWLSLLLVTVGLGAPTVLRRKRVG